MRNDRRQPVSRSLQKPIRWAQALAGFTLVEMLIASVVSAISMALIVNLTGHQIRLADNFYTTSTLNRRFNVFSNLMRAEFKDACLLRAGSAPSGVDCIPPAPPTVPDCGNLTTGVRTPDSSSSLFLRIPMLNPLNNQPVYLPIVRYYLEGTDLWREGPRVNADGNLDPSNPPTNPRDERQLVMNNVSAFVARVTPDCSSATLTLTLSLPGTATTQSRAFTHYVGNPAQY